MPVIFELKVQVTFPDSSEKSDVVKIRGPKQDVDAAYKHLQKLYKELLETSYSVKVSRCFVGFSREVELLFITSALAACASYDSAECSSIDGKC